MMKFKADLKQVYCQVEFDDDVPEYVFGDNQRLM